MRDRVAHQEALHLVALFVAQEIEMRLRLDAFGQNRDMQVLAEAQDRAHDRRRLMVGAHLVHEGAVELDLVERECVQGRERGIAGAEIVHRDGDAERLDLTQEVQRAVEILDQGGFGDLDFEP